MKEEEAEFRRVKKEEIETEAFYKRHGTSGFKQEV